MKEVISVLYLFGFVDQVHDDQVQVEITGTSEIQDYVVLPTWLFPCEIEEGIPFYFTKDAGVLELRCGEPPI